MSVRKVNNPKSYQDLSSDLSDNTPSRPCRDILCLILLVASLAGVTVSAIVGLSEGKLTLLGKPFDSTGVACGLDNSTYANTTSYPYLYFSPSSPSDFYCIKDCPLQISSKVDCFLSARTPNRNCPVAIPTEKVLLFCVPNITNVTALGIPQLQQLMSDTRVTLPLIIASAGFSLVFGMAVLIFSRCFMAVILWLLIVLSLLVTGSLSALGFMLNAGSPFARELIHWDTLPDLLKSQDVSLWIGILALVCFSVLLLMVLCFCSRINQSIAILKASAQFSFTHPHILAVPLLALVGCALIASVCAGTILLLYSTGQLNAGGGLPFAQFQPSTLAKGLMALVAFCWVWYSLLLFACSQFAIAHTATNWYYDRNSSLCCSLLKNLGSISFGSFLCALLLVLKWTIQIAQAYQERFQNPQNRLAQCLSRCATCCISMFERCLSFIAEHAYIVMAESGQNFLSSAESAVSIMASKPALFSICEFGNWLIASFTKAVVVGLSSAICIYLLTTSPSYVQHVFETWFPILLILFVSYPCAAILASFFQQTTNSLLMFVIKDKSTLLGSKCPDSLRKFIEEYD